MSQASSKLDSSLSKVIAEREVASTRWLSLVELTYEDPNGKTRTWNAVRRPTTSRASEADAVCVFAVLRGKHVKEPETLLVRQFRPATLGETIELPAGLIDDGESAETSALRELREECGYVGVVRAKTPPVVLSPGLSDESVVMVVVDVDLDDDANASPSQALEQSEFISVIRVPIHGLLRALDEYSRDGKRVFAGLYFLAWSFGSSSSAS